MKYEKTFKIIASIALITLATGCATRPAKQTTSKSEPINYGAYPEKYQDIISNYLENHAKDPESVKIKYISGPSKYHYQEGYLLENGDLYVGYGVCTKIMAKNGYGAYTGWQNSWFLIKDGSIKNFFSDSSGSASDSSKVKRACGKM